MSGKAYTPTEIDQHIGKRLQLRRMMMGLSLKDLANVCGVTFQQIQKYETADNRIAASRLFEIGAAMQTPVSFFFMGLPGNMPDETRANRSMRVSQQSDDDPLGKNESLTVINLYWQLPEKQREIIMQMLKSLNGVSLE
ncbi:MAG: helix-turn-helix transcriptional regulator [Alphaproteobacteria bacterium]|nr:helix-turn-helix transcriptional regulator [Alphaproteobacteria bacterium]